MHVGPTERPAGIVAGRHVLQVDAVSLHILNSQRQQLLEHCLQVGCAVPAEVTNKSKGALPHIWRWVLHAKSSLIIYSFESYRSVSKNPLLYVQSGCCFMRLEGSNQLRKCCSTPCSDLWHMKAIRQEATAAAAAAAAAGMRV